MEGTESSRLTYNNRTNIMLIVLRTGSTQTVCEVEVHYDDPRKCITHIPEVKHSPIRHTGFFLCWGIAAKHQFSSLYPLPFSLCRID